MTTEIAAQPTTAGTERSNPYAGPRSLREGEPIYGRSREIRELRSAILARRIVLLYSQSGAGKSSLIEAGLRPELQQRKFRVLPTVRVGYEPPSSTPGVNRYRLSVLTSLEKAKATAEQLDAEELSSIGLDDYFARIAAEEPDRDLCVVFDQFEELFTLDPADWDQKEEFLEELGDALADRGRWALFSMREDFIAQLDPYVSLMPTRFANRYRLGLLGPVAAEEAAQKPAREEGVDFTDEAAEQLVNDLRRIRVQRGTKSGDELGPSVEPVQLQVVCRQLWSNLAAAATTIGPDDVITGGNVNQALASFYDGELRSAVSRTSASEREVREWFEEKLISSDGFRMQTRKGPGRSGPAVMRELEDAHLIRADRRRGTDWYELTHDRFVEPIRISNAEFRRKRRRRSTRWIAIGTGLVAILAIAAVLVYAGTTGSAAVEAEVLTEDTETRELILEGNEIVHFQIDAATGDELTVTLVSTQGADLRLLRDEGGQLGAEVVRAVPDSSKEGGGDSEVAGTDAKQTQPQAPTALVLQYQLAMAGSYFIEVTSKGPGTFAFEYARSSGSTIPTLEVGSPVSGVLVDSSQTDLFAFDGTEGETVTIRLIPDADLDGILVLLDDTGSEVGFADSDGDGGVEKIAITLPVSGTYSVQVSGYEGSLGDYQLVLDRPEAIVVTIGEPVVGRIEAPGDASLYSYESAAGEVFEIDVTPLADLDLVLELTTPDGFSLLVDSRIEGGSETFLVAAPLGGTFLIGVAGYVDSTGDYELTLTRADVTEISFDRSVTATIAEPGDIDVYSFEAPAGEGYAIIVEPADELDSIVVVVDSEGIFVGEDAEGAGGAEALVGEMFIDGSVVVSVSGFEGSTGEYTLTLTDGDS
jgi:hypothetical protein